MPCLVASEKQRKIDRKARSLSSHLTDIDKNIIAVAVDTACVQNFTTVDSSIVTIFTIPPRRKDPNI
jgi:hypothetical protein